MHRNSYDKLLIGVGVFPTLFNPCYKGHNDMAQVNTKEVKEKDIGQIIRFLTNMFNQATSSLERPARNTKTGAVNEAYILQTEFAYILNELTQGPKCMQQKYIADCNEFIDQVIIELDSRK